MGYFQLILVIFLLVSQTRGISKDSTRSSNSDTTVSSEHGTTGDKTTGRLTKRATYECPEPKPVSSSSSFNAPYSSPQVPPYKPPKISSPYNQLPQSQPYRSAPNPSPSQANPPSPYSPPPNHPQYPPKYNPVHKPTQHYTYSPSYASSYSLPQAYSNSSPQYSAASSHGQHKHQTYSSAYSPAYNLPQGNPPYNKPAVPYSGSTYNSPYNIPKSPSYNPPNYNGPSLPQNSPIGSQYPAKGPSYTSFSTPYAHQAQSHYAGPYAQTYNNFIPINRFNHFIKPGNGQYDVEFESGNGIRQQESGFLKSLPSYGNSHGYGGGYNNNYHQNVANVKAGSVSWTSPEGIPFTLSYIADENGYRPVLTNHHTTTEHGGNQYANSYGYNGGSTTNYEVTAPSHYMPSYSAPSQTKFQYK